MRPKKQDRFRMRRTKQIEDRRRNAAVGGDDDVAADVNDHVFFLRNQ
jgi:hypothetical protein